MYGRKSFGNKVVEMLGDGLMNILCFLVVCIIGPGLYFSHRGGGTEPEDKLWVYFGSWLMLWGMLGLLGLDVLLASPA